MPPIKIALAEDHELIRKSLAQMLEKMGMEILFDVPNGKALIEAIKLRVPDIVLMDINMPEMNGIEATHYLHEHMPEVKVVALSITGEDSNVIKMIKAGARAYFVKNAGIDELVSAIKEVHEKGFHYSDLVNGALISNFSSPEVDPITDLSDRERTFLRLCCSDMTYKEIANTMHVSPRTAEGYAKQLFEKLNIKTRVGLVLYAVKHQLNQV